MTSRARDLLDAGTVLVIGIPIVCGIAALFVLAAFCARTEDRYRGRGRG